MSAQLPFIMSLNKRRFNTSVPLHIPYTGMFGVIHITIDVFISSHSGVDGVLDVSGWTTDETSLSSCRATISR